MLPQVFRNDSLEYTSDPKVYYNRLICFTVEDVSSITRLMLKGKMRRNFIFGTN